MFAGLGAAADRGGERGFATFMQAMNSTTGDGATAGSCTAGDVCFGPDTMPGVCLDSRTPGATYVSTSACPLPVARAHASEAGGPSGRLSTLTADPTRHGCLPNSSCRRAGARPGSPTARET